MAPTDRMVGRPAEGPAQVHVLLAEDDPAVRALFERLLAAQGWAVCAVTDGLEAVEAWTSRGGYDLAVLDVRMPRLNGYEAFLQMRAAAPGGRFLFVSGYAADELEPRLAREEGVAYMAKPFDSDALLERLSALLADAAARVGKEEG